MIQIIRAKMHGIKITGADLNYHGSISLDPELCALAGFYPLEFVDIWNKNSGHRISTYVIFGEAGSRCCILNGAAARTCQAGDDIIIAASEYINSPADLYKIKPKVLTFKENNIVDKILFYDVYKSAENSFNFKITEE